MRRLLRERLLHFLMIGVAVFAIYGVFQPRNEVQDGRLVQVTASHAERLAAQFETVWRRSPTESELAGLIDDHVREEIYYREALALGLERDDTVIRRRLRQKMEFLGEAGAAPLTPDEAHLRAHFEAHPERFIPPPRASFRQVFLGDAAAAPVLAAIEGGADPSGLGTATLLPPAMEAAPEAAVDGTFGEGFFAAVAGLEAGMWTGPVGSAFGQHLVHLIEAEPATTPPFEAVRPLVEEDWRRAKADELREAQYRELRARYEVVLPERAP